MILVSALPHLLFCFVIIRPQYTLLPIPPSMRGPNTLNWITISTEIKSMTARSNCSLFDHNINLQMPLWSLYHHPPCFHCYPRWLLQTYTAHLEEGVLRLTNLTTPTSSPAGSDSGSCTSPFSCMSVISVSFTCVYVITWHACIYALLHYVHVSLI